MKTGIISILMTITLIFTITGCKKAPINNEIEGFWILDNFTILETNEKIKCERIYYAITRMLTEISEKQGPNGYGTYIGCTEYRNNETQLVLKDFKVRIGTADNGENAPTDKLKHFGINNQRETIFNIVHCNGKTMTLESNYARLELEKF